MALTHSVLFKTNIGHKRIVLANTTFDSSYATGGLALTPKNVGLREISGILVGSASGYEVHYDKTNAKLKAFTTAGTEVANGTNLSTIVATIAYLGI